MITCDKCKADFDQDDVVWANQKGQLIEGSNNFPWCVSCLPSQETICGDCLIPLSTCQHAKDYVLSNNDKKILRLIASSLATKGLK